MTKAELIERVYAGKHLPRELTKKTVAQIVDAVFVEMGDYFIRTRVSRTQGPRLTYPGFGTFSKRRRGERSIVEVVDHLDIRMMRSGLAGEVSRPKQRLRLFGRSRSRDIFA